MILGDPKNFLQTSMAGAGLLAVLILIFFYDVIFLGHTLLSTNAESGTLSTGAYGYKGYRPVLDHVIDRGVPIWNHEPTTSLTSRIYKSGYIPLWNPHEALGTPLAADMISSAFFPLSFLLYADPSPAMWDFFLILRVFIAGFGTYLFLYRFLGLGQPASLTGAASYMFCGFILLYINIVFINVAILVPWLVYATEQWVQRPRPRSLGFLSMLVACSVLGGHPETTLFALFYVTVYYLVRMEKVGAWGKRLGLFIGSMLLGGLLSGLLILPFLEFIAYSVLGPHEAGVKGGTWHLPLSRIFMLWVPYFWGPVRQSWDGTDWSFQPGYIGMVAAVLALSVFFSRSALRGAGRSDRMIPFFIGMIVLFILKGYGVPKFFNDFVGSLPLFEVSYFMKYFGPEFMFSVAVLVGFQIHQIEGRSGSLKPLIFSASLGLGSLGLLVWLNYPEVVKHIDRPYTVPSWTVSVTRSVTRSYFLKQLIPPLLFCLLIGAGGYLAHRKALSPGRFSRLLSLALIIELFILMPHDHFQRYPSFTPAPYVQLLQKDPDTFRVYSIGTALYPNTASAYGLDDVGSVNGLCLRRYAAFSYTLISPKFFYCHFTAQNPVGGIRNVDNRFFNLLNLKYTLDDPAGPGAPPPFEKIYEGEVKLYRNPDYFPRAFVVHRAEVVQEEGEALRRLKDEQFDLRTQIVLEEPDGRVEEWEKGRRGGGERSRAEDSVEMVEHGYNRVILKAQLTTPGFLVLSDPYFPGWRVFVDGAEKKIYPTNYLFRSVFLDEGSHTVRFQYQPTSYKVGAWLTLMGVLILAGIFGKDLFHMGRR